MPQKRQNLSSGTAWEPLVGYSRAVRIGDSIHVSGTTATDENGELVGEGDAYRQTVQALSNIEKALRGLGGELQHVIRTRIYVTDIEQWADIGRAHGEFFSYISPASTMVEVKRLIKPGMLVEIEAEAVVP